MIIDPTSFRQIYKIDRSILFSWVLRIARDVEHLDNLGVAQAANDVLERFINDQQVSEDELNLISAQTYNQCSWPAYCSANASQIAISTMYPNTKLYNDGTRADFLPYIKGDAKYGGLYPIKTWDEHIAASFIYPVQWAINAHLYPSIAERKYLDWLNEML